MTASTSEIAYFDKVNLPSFSSAFENKINEICNECAFWKIHPAGYPNQHKSCICELFGNQSICCLEGYSNLMWNIPYMIIYAPTPNKYIYHTLNPYTIPIQIRSDQIIDIVNFSNNLKINLIPELKFPYKNHSYIVNQENGKT